MKTILQKIGICLLLLLCVGKGFGQEEDDEENRFLVSVNCSGLYLRAFSAMLNGYQTYSGQQTYDGYTIYEMNFEPIYIDFFNETRSSLNFNYCNMRSNPGYYGLLDPFNSFACTGSIIYVDGPVIIKNVTFENLAINYACPDNRIKLELDVHALGDSYTNSFDFTIECRNESGNWTFVSDKIGKNTTSTMCISDNIQYVYLDYSDFLNKPGLDPHQKMYFRTRRSLTYARYWESEFASTSTFSTKSLFYLPKFQFPAGTSVIVEPPTCAGGNTTIKIPYTGTADYTVTVKGTDDYSWGSNPSLLGCPTEIIDGIKYYRLPMKLDVGNYRLVIENKADANSPCAYISDPPFEVPKVPDFTISQSTYTTYTDNSQQPIQIRTREGTASVSFDIAGSKNQSVTIHAGGSNNFIKQLTSSYLVGDSTYYQGTVSIDLPKGTYTNVYVDNASNCSATSYGTFELKETTAITFTATPTDPKCNGEGGSITLSSIGGGIGARTYSLNNDTPLSFTTSTVEILNIPSGNNQTIKMSDNYGNSSSQSFNIAVAPLAIDTVKTIITPPTTSGIGDGTVTVTLEGGTPPYKTGNSYEDLPSNTFTLTGFSSGNQQIIYIKDANDCPFQFKVDIPEGRKITVESTTTTAPTCNGYPDGKCVLVIGNAKGELSVSGLPSDCSLNISNDTIITITGLEAKDYPCKILEDYEGQRNEIPLSFTIPPKPAINIVPTVTPVTNKNSATGKIAVSVSGGNSGPYQVNLLDEQNNTIEEKNNISDNCIFENLAGAYSNNGKLYTIQVIDNEVCEKDTTAQILEPEIALQLAATLTKPVSCHDDSDATIDILADGGWGSYKYSTDSLTWNTTTTFSNLAADTYKFFVKDNNGGTATTSITVINPNSLNIVLQSATDAVCFNSATGSFRFLVSGGTPPYSLTPALGTVTTTTESGNTYITVSELPATNYTFTLKDSHNCILQAEQATIGQPDELTISTSNLTHPTCGWENGSITATASGGIAPYIYVLKVTGTDAAVQTKTSSVAVLFENIAGGNYYIAVTDKNGCTKPSSQLIFNQYTSPAISGATINDVNCFDESNGKITATAQKGTTNIDYFTLTKSSNNTTIQNTTGIFEDLTADDYILYVFDTNGCQSQNAYPVTVKQPDVLRIEVDTIVPVINKGAGDGKIQFRVTGGNTGNALVYLRDDENTKVDSVSTIRGFTNELSVKAGTYTLEATDCKDCSFTTEILQVEEPADSLRLIIKEVQDALCKSQTGKITVEGQGGWGGYRYKRAVDGQFTTLNRFENLYPGTYFITVTDKMGATASQSVTVYEPQDSLKAEIVDIQVPTCAANGAMSIALSGGTPPYKLFSDNVNDTIFSVIPETIQWENIASGSLLLHLTDANGCKFELETVVSDTALLRINGFEIIPPNVPQVPNGSILAKISGGTNPLIYTWRKIGTTASFPNNPLINNLSSGYYELKVTDGNDCSAINSVYLPDPSDGTLIVVETRHVTSLHAANGYAILYSGLNFTNIRVVNPENNYADYPATTNNVDFHIRNDSIYLNNLESGKWFVSGTTSTGQNAIASFEIKPYEAFVFGKIEIINASTPDGSNGSISVEIQGGAGENTFVWTDEQGNILSSDNDEYNTRLSDLPAGIYTLVVTDKYGNTISKEIEVLAPEQALQLTTLEQKNQSCNGTVDAYVILSATGGWGDYRYAHYRKSGNTGLEYNNTEVYSELETGEHYFYVVDKYGTTAQLQVTVTEPDLLRASVAGIENVKCKDDVNGQITFNISGGNTPYYFKELNASIWQKGNVTNYLPAGEYTFEFTDSLQCVCPDMLTVTITEPDSLLFKSVDVTHTTCGEDNGQMLVALKGGTRPYTYQWKDAGDNIIGTDSIIKNLKQSALYRLYVSDKNGCTQYLEQLINPSKLPRITSVETTDVLCYSDFTGAARITAVEAGEPYSPYAFTWSNGTTGDATGNLPAGRHSVTITDENNCATTYYFDIYQPDSLYLLITDYKEPHCFGYSDGYIHTQAFGGAGDYTYLWSNGATTPDNDSIPTGDYWVRVTDKHGCVFEKQFTLNEPPYQHIDLGKDLMMCPGNTHVIDGGDYVSYRWFTDKGNISRERYLSVTKEDRYYLEATTPDGCSAWGDIGITIGNSALQAGMLLASEAAVGDTLVIFELSNLPLDSLQWEYDTAVFERISITNEYYDLPYVLQLRCLQTGVYNIGLAAFSGGCYAPVVKQVEIVEAGDKEDDDAWGAKEPLIQTLKQYPNPTDGLFTVELELREAAEAKFVIFEVASGICVNQRTETGSDYYKVDYDLTHFQTGVYVLIVTAGNERRQVKIVIE